MEFIGQCFQKLKPRSEQTYVRFHTHVYRQTDRQTHANTHTHTQTRANVLPRMVIIARPVVDDSVIKLITFASKEISTSANVDIKVQQRHLIMA